MNRSSEAYSVAAILSLTGGFLDAYTYVSRDGVFANAQTGNFARLAISLANGELWLVLRYVIPIMSFVAGVSAAMWIRRHTPGIKALRWQHWCLLLEILLLATVSLIPGGRIFNIAANIMVSFTCAVQAETFRKVLGTPFSSTMCTGNLRNATEYLNQFLQAKEASLLRKSIQYFGIDILFVIGAVIGTWMTKAFHIRATFFCCVLLGTVLLMLPEADIEPGKKSPHCH